MKKEWVIAADSRAAFRVATKIAIGFYPRLYECKKDAERTLKTYPLLLRQGYKVFEIAV